MCFLLVSSLASAGPSFVCVGFHSFFCCFSLVFHWFVFSGFWFALVVYLVFILLLVLSLVFIVFSLCFFAVLLFLFIVVSLVVNCQAWP